MRAPPSITLTTSGLKNDHRQAHNPKNYIHTYRYMNIYIHTYMLIWKQKYLWAGWVGARKKTPSKRGTSMRLTTLYSACYLSCVELKNLVRSPPKAGITRHANSFWLLTKV